MRKAVIVFVSIIILVVLIGFNISLWNNYNKEAAVQELEVEKVQYEEYNRNLQEDLNTVRKIRDGLQDEINQFEEVELAYKDSIENLELEQNDLTKDILAYEVDFLKMQVLVTELKKTVNEDFFKEFLNDGWVSYINVNNYSLPFYYQDGTILLGGRKEGKLKDFSSQFINIESMEIIEVNPIEVTSGGDPFIISFNILFNVILTKDEEELPLNNPYFTEGENLFLVSFYYNIDDERWLINTMD